MQLGGASRKHLATCYKDYARNLLHPDIIKTSAIIRYDTR
jgi:hypothetical protein